MKQSSKRLSGALLWIDQMDAFELSIMRLAVEAKLHEKASVREWRLDASAGSFASWQER